MNNAEANSATAEHERTECALAERVNKKLGIKVFGLGGAGTHVVEEMMRSGFPGLTFVALHTDTATLASSTASEKMLLDPKTIRELETATDEQAARAALKELLPQIKGQCAGAEAVFIVCGLGGKTGTALGPLLAQLAKEASALVLAFVTMPFDFEGSGRQKHARAGLESLKAAADAVVCLPNQRIFKLIDEKTSLVNTFKLSNELLTDGVRAIWRLLTYTALIEIHFADLCALMRDRHHESAFAVAEATGPDRAGEVVGKLLAHPMLDAGQVLADSETGVVSLMGGPDLTMAEVSRVMEQINSRCEGAQVMMGAAIDPEFENRLAVIVIAARGERQEEEQSENGNSRAPQQRTRTASEGSDSDIETHFLNATTTGRPASRIVPPPPSLSLEQVKELGRKNGGRARRNAAKMAQGQLPLEIVSKGRFDKSEPTIHKGEDLDVPTYIRRGVVLN